MNQRGHVFVSYSRQDGNAFATHLHAALEASGFPIWRDVRDLKAGQDFTADLETALESASHVVVCLTPDAKRDNSFVRREIQYALLIDEERRNTRTGAALPVIPLRFEEIKPHISIVNNEWIDFFRGWSPAFERLFHILSDDGYQNQPSGEPLDPHRSYLQASLKRVNSYLKQAIIRPIADLPAEPAPDAVEAQSDLPSLTAPTPSRSDQFQLLFAALPLNDGGSEPDTEIPFTSFRDGFERYNRRSLLLGEPGAGKTVMLMAYARDAIVARLDDPTAPLPLLGLIATWNPDRNAPLAPWLAALAGEHLPEAAVRSVLDEGRALLLLDGLDELGEERPVDPQGPDGETYDPRVRFIAQLEPILNTRTTTRAGQNALLITSRVAEYAALKTKLPLDGAIRLQPLTDGLIQSYLADYPGLWSLLRSDDKLRQLARTPLLLSLFTFAFRDLPQDDRAALKDLSDSLDLRDRIFTFYVAKRYKHEAARRQLPLTLDELTHSLGKLALGNASSSLQSENILTRDEVLRAAPDRRVSDFVDLAVQLHILAHAGHDRRQRATFRFHHLLLRDFFVSTFCLPHLHDSTDLPPDGLRVNVETFIGALGTVRERRALPWLLANLRNTDSSSRNVRYYVAKALEQIGWQPESAQDGVIFSIAAHRWEDSVAFGDLAVPGLLEALRDWDRAVSTGAAQALGQIGASVAIPGLIAKLGDAIAGIEAATANHVHGVDTYNKDYQHWAVLNAAAGALNEIGDTAVPKLLDALEHSSSYGRRGAAYALGRIGEATTVPRLLDALTDSDEGVRWSVADALGKIGDPRAVPGLIELLSDTADVKYWKGGRVSESAAEALERIGTSEALLALERWALSQ